MPIMKGVSSAGYELLYHAVAAGVSLRGYGAGRAGMATFFLRADSL